MRCFKSNCAKKFNIASCTQKNNWLCTINHFSTLETKENNVYNISESVISCNSSSLKLTSKDYYSQYSQSFFKDSYQKMIKDIENMDEFNPQFSLTKKFEEESIIGIEPGVIKTPNSILKIQLKVTQQHLGEKKRLRLDDYLFKRLIFAVFHYNNNNNNDDNENLMSPIQLRFRLFGMNFIEISIEIIIITNIQKMAKRKREQDKH